MEQMVTVRAGEVRLFSYWSFFIQPIRDNFGPGNMYVFQIRRSVLLPQMIFQRTKLPKHL